MCSSMLNCLHSISRRGIFQPKKDKSLRRLSEVFLIFLLCVQVNLGLRLLKRKRGVSPIETDSRVTWSVTTESTLQGDDFCLMMCISCKSLDFVQKSEKRIVNAW